MILVGRLGNDPEGRVSQSGSAMTNLSLATTRSWKDQQGERQEKTEWHSVVLFGRIAEVAQEYLRKGSQVYIEGRLQMRKWQDKSGYDRYTTEVIGNTMQMIGGKGDEYRQGSYSSHAQASEVGTETPQTDHSNLPRLEDDSDSWPF